MTARVFFVTLTPVFCKYFYSLNNSPQETDNS